MKTNLKIDDFVIRTTLLMGVILALIQFFSNRSLWIDEAFLALNIIDKDFLELLKPLDYNQSAPILFLMLEKLFSNIIPNSEYGLRLFPLISYLLSLFFFYRIIFSVHKDNHTVIFALSLFVFNATIIYYSSEVKQYMTDVLMITCIYFISIKDYRNTDLKYLYLIIAGVISIFLSNITPIILLTSGLHLLVENINQKKKSIFPLISVFIAWTLTFSAYYILFIYDHPLKELMVLAHQNYFMPLNPFSKEFYEFFVRIGPMVTCGLFRFTIFGGILIVLFAAVGFIWLLKKGRKDLLILTISPIVIHFLLSSIELYPVQKRMILYLSVCIIMLCSFGFDVLFTTFYPRIKTKFVGLSTVIIPFSVILLMCFSIINKGFPVGMNSDIKKSINFIEKRMEIDDKVHVINWDATIPFQYYKEISYVRMNPQCVFLNNDFPNGVLDFTNRLASLSGRNWFLFGPEFDGNMKLNIMKSIFDKSGKDCIIEYHTKGSDIFLYDL